MAHNNDTHRDVPTAYDEKALAAAEEGYGNGTAAVSHVRYGPLPSATSGIGNPAPLGLLCFGMTTIFLMFVVTKWSEVAFEFNTVILYACFYGGFGQMVAGVFELIKGNTFAGTAFFTYGAFWMATFTSKLLGLQGLVHAEAYPVGTTLYFVAFGCFTFLMFIPTLRKNLCLMVVFGSLSVTFWLLAGGVWSPACNQAAGYVGFFCGLSAIYAAFAEIYEETLKINMPGLRAVNFL